MKKIIMLLVLFLSISILLIGCGKSNSAQSNPTKSSQTESNPLIGKWKDNHDIIEFKSDGIFTAQNYWLGGSYTVSGDQLTLSPSTEDIQEFTYQINNDGHLILNNNKKGTYYNFINANNSTKDQNKGNSVTKKASEEVNNEKDFVFEKEEGRIKIYNGSKSVLHIPDKIGGVKVTIIGESAFRNDSNVTSVTMPNSVTRIEGGAFMGCRNLKNINIPNSVTKIEDDTFWFCSSLIDVTIPSSVTSIGYLAFGDCGSLTNVTIPSSVTSIANQAFSGCGKAKFNVQNEQTKQLLINSGVDASKISING